MPPASPAISTNGFVGSLGSILKAAVVAGVIAGAAVAGFHSVLIGPVIERAIQIEERLSGAPGEVAPQPLVDRPTQRWGLVAGFLLYGATWGLLYGVLVCVTRAWHAPSWTSAGGGFVLALLAGWSVAVFPFLKYPANPPGVGEPGTIAYRQTLYFGFIGLSAAGTGLAVGFHRLLNRVARWVPTGRARFMVALALYVVYAAGMYLAMPAYPDPVRMPAQLIWTFRAISFAALVLFWVMLGGLFGWLSRRKAQDAG